MTNRKDLQLRISVTLERIEMFNEMIERTKTFMPEDKEMLKDRENIRNEMVDELYSMLAELGIYNPQQLVAKAKLAVA
jgi:hypothetical protein